MKMGIGFNLFAFSLSGLLILSGCGGGDETPAASAPTSKPAPTISAYFFAGYTQSSGEELWKSDGTESGTSLVKEINKRADSSNPDNFIEVGNTVYFTANDMTHGTELWKSDVNGVSMVKDIYPAGSSEPHSFVANASTGKLYFVANDGASSQGLWETNGSPDGTIKIGDFDGVENLTVMPTNNALFFTTAGGSELWRYNGTDVPATPVVASGTFSDATKLTVVQDRLYFIAYSASAGIELWSSNGVDATAMIADLCADTCNGMDQYSSLFLVNGNLIFTDVNRVIYLANGVDYAVVSDTSGASLGLYNWYSAGASGRWFYFQRDYNNLWRTDGVTSHLVFSGSIYSPYNFQSAGNGEVFFQTSDDTLWKSNGTQGGTVRMATNSNIYNYKLNATGNLVYLYDYDYYTSNYRVASITTDGSNQITRLIDVNSDEPTLNAGANKLYMAYTDAAHGNEPWVSDGTAEGTGLLADVNPGKSAGSLPYGKVELNGEIYFVATDGNNYGLWKSNGTEAGTVQLAKYLQSIESLTVSGGKLFFVADDNAYGRELWVSDGTEAGTHMVIDLAQGNNSSSPYSLVDANGMLFFVDDEYGYLWKSDGTLEGTMLVSDINPGSDLIAAGDKVYFVNYDRNFGSELWVSNGTYAGTKMVNDINPGGGSGVRNNPFKAKAVGDVLFFAANDGATGLELWKTDGSEAGTKIVMDLNGADDGLDINRQNFFAANGLLYFMAYNANNELELWSTDGTADKTMALTSLLQSGGTVNYGAGFEFYKGELFFSATNGVDGAELWKIDSVSGNAVMLKNINQAGDSSPRGFSVFNDILFFTANDGDHGRELWKSNGTEAGTEMVKDVASGEASGSAVLPDVGGYGKKIKVR